MDFCRNPDDGICRQKTSVPKRMPSSSPSEEPHPSSSFGLCRDESGMLPHVAPSLSAPERKDRSQSRLRPRKLRVIRLSLRSSRLAAACCLRRSCRRDRGPVALPRSGCPVRRSQHPAAFAQSLLPPLPAAFCGPGPQLRRSPCPQNAVPYSQSIRRYRSKTPSPDTCLILRYTSDQPARCALRARSF